jgi:hypothetical protein
VLQEPPELEATLATLHTGSTLEEDVESCLELMDADTDENTTTTTTTTTAIASSTIATTIITTTATATNTDDGDTFVRYITPSIAMEGSNFGINHGSARLTVARSFLYCSA